MVLKANGSAGAGHFAEGRKPVRLGCRRQLLDPVTHGIGEAGEASECRIDLEELIVAAPTVLVEPHFDDAVTLVERVE